MYQQLETAQAFPSEQNDGMLTCVLFTQQRNSKYCSIEAYYSKCLLQLILLLPIVCEQVFFSRTHEQSVLGELFHLCKSRRTKCAITIPRSRRGRRDPWAHKSLCLFSPLFHSAFVPLVVPKNSFKGKGRRRRRRKGKLDLRPQQLS